MIRLLLGLLVIQLAITAALYAPRDVDRPVRSALVEGVVASDVAALTVTGDDGSSSLRRDGERWYLASGLPVDREKIDTLLSALLQQDPGFAIATSAGAAERFEVAADSFQRHIELLAGGEPTSVYLGTSPAFRKIHGRRDGEDAVYVLNLNSYDAPTTDEAWFDRALLATRELTRMGFFGNTLQRIDGSWLREDGDALDPAHAEALAVALGGLRVSGIVENSDEALAAATESLRLDLADDEDVTELVLLVNDEQDRYFLQSDRYAQVFSTSAYDAERLTEAVATLMAGMADADEAAKTDTILEPQDQE